MSAINAGSSLVRWIEGHSFFGRPRYDKRQLTCQQAEQLADYVLRLSTCRVRAAYTCVTPEVGFTWTGDACVCSTLWGYASKFSACWADTPYSACYDDINNDNQYSSWSSDHCTTTKPPDSSKAIEPTTTPTPPAPAPAPSTIPPPSPPAPSSPQDSKPEQTTQRDDPKPTDPPRATDPPKPSPEDAKTEPQNSSISTPKSVPQLSFVPISVAPKTPIESIGATTTTGPSHSPLARWTSAGAILRGYCADADYTIIDGPTAYWAPVVGCVGDKPDCCPFDIPPSTFAVQAAAAETSPASGNNVITTADSSNRGFPSALSPAQATLSSCPDDYHSIGNGCCPSEYFPWSTAFGGQTPCYSTLLGAMTPPPITASAAPDSSKPTSAIVNVVYAMQYPLKPVPSKPGLATGAKIGIGVGAGVAAIVFGILTVLLLWKHRAHKRDKAALEEMSGIGSTRQSVAASSAYGGVKDWRKNVSSEVASGLEPIQEPTLPQVGAPPQAYSADWRPVQQRTVSPPVPHPGYYSRSTLPSPPLPEGYSEVGSDGGFGNRSSNGFSNGNRSELHSGDYSLERQELQGGHVEWQHGGVPTNAWPPEGAPQQVRYYEAPTGRMTPRIPPKMPGEY